MPVELRARRSRPSYSLMFALPDDEEGEQEPRDEDGSSESAFEPPEADDQEVVAEDESAAHDSDQEADLMQADNSDIATGTTSKSKEKAKAKAKAKTKGKGKGKGTGSSITASLHRSTVVPAPSLSRPSARQLYALPLPSGNHRHRGAPVYYPPLRTLRLLEKPKLFAHVKTVVTQSISEPQITTRVSKAHMNNIGRGPVWQLMEDRSWFKECDAGHQDRPIVYKSLGLKDGWQLLTPEGAFSYLPSNQKDLESSPSLTCFFGPYSDQKKMNMSIFDAVKMADHIPGSNSHVFYAGAPVWATDWRPISSEELERRNYKQYLAVAPFPSDAHSPEIGRRVDRPSPACIQIWSLSPAHPPSENRQKYHTNVTEDPGVMSCEMVLCLDGGPAHDIKWCPLPAHDEYGKPSASAEKKLGILAGTFEDGSLSLYVVPDPQSFRRPDATLTGPIFVKLEPHVRIELEDTSCWCIDWANSDLIATGCTNGSVAVFRLNEALNDSDMQEHTFEGLRPSHYLRLHQSAVRAVCWVRAPPTAGSGVVRLDRDPTVVISGGYDGAHIVTDIRDRRGNVMNRTRDVTNSIAFSHHVGGPLISDNENMVKNFGMMPSTLGRGHAVMDAGGPVWSISTSDFHPQVAVGSADGSCETTNIMKATRRGGLAPFFIHKIFQMDYSRATGEFRMLENFVPHEYQDRPSATRPNKKKGPVDELPEQISTSAWSPEIAVTRVVWQSGSGLARAPLLASSTASGLCRIDWLLGRFANDRFPYTNIEMLRGEVEGAVDEEMDED